MRQCGKTRFLTQAALAAAGSFWSIYICADAMAQQPVDGAVTASPQVELPPAVVPAPDEQPPAELPQAKSDAAPVNLSPEAPAAAATAAPANAQPAPAGPTAAEMAIIQNAAVLDTITPPAPVAATPGTQAGGALVSDILSQEANIRPLPEKYLIVRKDRDADETGTQLTAARTALSRGHNTAAFELFDEIYRKNPLDMRAALGRAVALQKLGQYDDALAAYEIAISRDPNNVEALTNMLGLLRTQDPEAALVRLLRLRERYPARAEITAQLGMVYGVAGDYDNAIKYLDMADALQPGNATVLYNKAVVYDRRGNSTRAAELYRQIVLMAADGSIDQSLPVDTIKKRLAVIR